MNRGGCYPDKVGMQVSRFAGRSIKKVYDLTVSLMKQLLIE
jgi:hypothetical protein